jgi:hypothetical protein
LEPIRRHDTDPVRHPPGLSRRAAMRSKPRKPPDGGAPMNRERPETVAGRGHTRTRSGHGERTRRPADSRGQREEAENKRKVARREGLALRP